MGSLTRSDGAFPTTNTARNYHVNSPSQPTMGSCPFHSLNCGLLPPSIVRHLCRSCPHSLMGSSILFIYLFIIIIYFLLSRSFPSHCGGSFPSQWSSSPSHCGLLPFSLSHWGSSLPQHGPLSHRTQVRGSSPSSRGGGGPLPPTTGAVFHLGCSALPLS